MTFYWNEEYADLPLLQVKPCHMDDSDVDFHSDMSYFRELLLEIQLQAMTGSRVTAFPIVLSDELDHALIEMAGIKAHIEAMSRG